MKGINVKILVGISMLGAVMVSLGESLAANLIWSVSNPIMAWYNYRVNQKEQSILFAVYSIIAWFGVINLWK